MSILPCSLCSSQVTRGGSGIPCMAPAALQGYLELTEVTVKIVLLSSVCLAGSWLRLMFEKLYQ